MNLERDSLVLDPEVEAVETPAKTGCLTKLKLHCKGCCDIFCRGKKRRFSRHFHLRIRGVDIKLGYFLYMLTSIVGIANLCHTVYFASKQGTPNSVNVDIVYYSNIGAIVCAIFIPLVALYLIMRKDATTAISIVVWFFMTVAMAFCIVVLIRVAFWFGLNKDGKFQDIKDYTLQRESKMKGPSKSMIYTSRTYECCGIANYTDWEAIYEEIGSTKAEKGRTRKLPEFCCKEPYDGCGTGIILEIFDSMEHISSVCQDPDEEFNGHCQNIKKGIEDKTLDENNVTTVYVTDPRINPIQSKKSIGDLPEVEKICEVNDNKKPSFFKPVMLYYKGYLYWDEVTYPNNKTTNFSIACFPQRVDDEEKAYAANNTFVRRCVNDTIPIQSFHHAFGFCHWIRGRSNLSSFTIQERLDLVEQDNQLYFKGCQTYLIKYINRMAITALGYSITMLILFILMLIVYHFYYTEFREAQLRNMPAPRWYEPMGKEKTRLTPFGDIDYIPDANLNHIPPARANAILYVPTPPPTPPPEEEQLSSAQITAEESLSSKGAKKGQRGQNQKAKVEPLRKGRAKPRKSDVEFVFDN